MPGPTSRPSCWSNRRPCESDLHVPIAPGHPLLGRTARATGGLSARARACVRVGLGGRLLLLGCHRSRALQEGDPLRPVPGHPRRPAVPNGLVSADGARRRLPHEARDAVGIRGPCFDARARRWGATGSCDRAVPDRRVRHEDKGAPPRSEPALSSVVHGCSTERVPRLDRRLLAAPICQRVSPANRRNADFLSKRVGTYQYNPQWGVLLSQLWVK